MNFKSKLSVWCYGTFASLLFKPTTPPEKMRRRFERVGVVSRERLSKKYPSIRFDSHVLNGIPAESTQCKEAYERIVLHLHGGMYIMGTSASFRVRAKNISYRANAKVYVVDYRKSPENVFPAALEDVYQAYLALRQLHPDKKICVSGDSCGGGLVLSLTSYLRGKNVPLPDAILSFSPWTDLKNSGESYRYNRKKDGWLRIDHAKMAARAYAGSACISDPLVSPIYAEFKNFPPTLFITGDHEVLLDDTLRCVQKMRDQGVSTKVHLGKGMTHDFPLSLPWIDESKRAWGEVSRFLDDYC